MDATFSLTGDDETECIKGVQTFKYLGRMVYRSDNDWIRLGKLLRKEGAYLLVSEMFYWEVV